MVNSRWKELNVYHGFDYIIFIVCAELISEKKKKDRKYNDERYLLFNILFFENNILNDRKLFNYKILRNVTNNNIPLKMMKRNGKTCWCVTFYAVISKFMLVILRAFFQLQGNAILDSFVFFRYEKKKTLYDTKCIKESLVTKLKIRKEKLKNKMRSEKYIVILTKNLY